MIVGFSVAFIVFNYITKAEIDKDAEKEDKIKYSYSYETSMYVYPVENSLISKESYKEYLFDEFYKLGGDGYTVFIINLVPYVDAVAGNVITDVYIGGDMPKYPIISGDYPSIDMLQSGEHYAVLGKSRKHYTYKKNGKEYIKINNDEYMVTGYVASDKSRILNNKILLFGNNVDDGIWNDMDYYLKSGEVMLLFQSDIMENLQEIVREQANQLSNDRIGAVDGMAIKRMLTTDVPQFGFRMFASLIYIFCIITTIFTIEFWLMQRKMEFAIRKSFGYTTGKLMGLLLIEILVMIILSVIFAEIAIIAINYIQGEMITFSIKKVYYNFVAAVMYSIFTLILSSVYPLIKLLKNNPIRLMTEKGGE